jgi:hypothetical protein
MSERIDELNRLTLRDFPNLFRTLQVPDRMALSGYFRGSILGPTWFQRIARPLLAIAGLGGWWGKYFDGEGNGTNLVEREGGIQRRLPVRAVNITSMVDGLPGLTLQYLSDNPFPWPFIVDELRQLEPGLLLGMMVVNVGILRRLAFPFLLQAQE